MGNHAITSSARASKVEGTVSPSTLAAWALMTSSRSRLRRKLFFVVHALVNCLRDNGALRSGQIEQTLRATIDSAGNERARLDYVWLQDLLNRLEGHPEPTTH